MVGLVVDCGPIRLKPVSPASLVFQLAVKSLPALGLFLGIKQKELGSLDHEDICSPSDFQQAQDVLRLFLHPLVAADGGDAEHVKLLRLEEDENGLLVAGTGPAGVLVDDDFDLLGGGGVCEQNSYYRYQ